MSKKLDGKTAAITGGSAGISLGKGSGVRVNVLSPGHTDTPGFSVLISDEHKAGDPESSGAPGRPNSN